LSPHPIQCGDSPKTEAPKEGELDRPAAIDAEGESILSTLEQFRLAREAEFLQKLVDRKRVGGEEIKIFRAPMAKPQADARPP
jgi:hypothetical protein